MGRQQLGLAPLTVFDTSTKGYVDTFVAGVANLAPGSTLTVDYVFGATNAYPTRPTARTDIVVMWRGPTAPTLGGGFALTGDEWKVKTS